MCRKVLWAFPCHPPFIMSNLRCEGKDYYPVCLKSSLPLTLYFANPLPRSYNSETIKKVFIKMKISDPPASWWCRPWRQWPGPCLSCEWVLSLRVSLSSPGWGPAPQSAWAGLRVLASSAGRVRLTRVRSLASDGARAGPGDPTLPVTCYPQTLDNTGLWLNCQVSVWVGMGAA